MFRTLRATSSPIFPTRFWSDKKERLEVFVGPFLKHLAIGGPNTAAPYLWVFGLVATGHNDEKPLSIPTRKKYLSDMTAGLGSYLARIIQRGEASESALSTDKYTWIGLNCAPM